MRHTSLEDRLNEYDSPIQALRQSDIEENPLPEGEQRPSEYTNWMEEQLSWKNTCYIGDWSFMPDLRITGPDAIDLFSDLTVNSFEHFPVGKAKHAVQCNENGDIIGDGILYRLEEGTLHTQHLAAWPMFNAQTGDYEVTTELQDSFIFQVQGPTSIEVLQKLVSEPLRELPFMHVIKSEINGKPVRILRQGMSGEIGFELQGPQEYGDKIWSTIVDAGQEHGIRQLGKRTHMLNHLEMGFSTRGHHYLPAIFGDDMKDYRSFLDADDAAEANFTLSGSFDGDDIRDWYRSPVELGWTRNIKFDHDFIGREALEDEVENPARTTVTLEWAKEDVIDVYASLFRDGDHYKYMEMPYQKYRAIEADRVLKDGEDVGVSTGRGYSYYFNEMISLCTIDLEHSEVGTELTLLWGEGGNPDNPKIEPHVQKEMSARVASLPYKDDNRREQL